MFKNLSYNQRKCFRFVAAVVVVFLYILEFVAGDLLPEWFIKYGLLLAIIAYLVGIFLCGSVRGISSKVMQDELTILNEKRATEITRTTAVVLIALGIVFSQITDRPVVLSYNVLVCMLVAVFVIEDGCYLVLEKRGCSDADTEDEG